MSPARGSADCEDADVDFIFNLSVPVLMMAGEVPIAPEMQMLTVMVQWFGFARIEISLLLAISTPA